MHHAPGAGAKPSGPKNGMSPTSTISVVAGRGGRLAGALRSAPRRGRGCARPSRPRTGRGRSPASSPTLTCHMPHAADQPRAPSQATIRQLEQRRLAPRAAARPPWRSGRPEGAQHQRARRRGVLGASSAVRADGKGHGVRGRLGSSDRPGAPWGLIGAQRRIRAASMSPTAQRPIRREGRRIGLRARPPTRLRRSLRTLAGHGRRRLRPPATCCEAAGLPASSGPRAGWAALGVQIQSVAMGWQVYDLVAPGAPGRRTTPRSTSA